MPRSRRPTIAREQECQHRNDGLPGSPVAMQTSEAVGEKEARVRAAVQHLDAASGALARASRLLVPGPHRGEMSSRGAARGRARQRGDREGHPGHELRTDAAAFLDGVEAANALMQNPPDDGNIYRPLAPTPSEERTCPWCAETMKAAAVICRFCSRDAQVQPDAGSSNRHLRRPRSCSIGSAPRPPTAQPGSTIVFYWRLTAERPRRASRPGRFVRSPAAAFPT